MLIQSSKNKKSSCLTWVYLSVFLLLKVNVVYAAGIVIGNGIDHITENQLRELYWGKINEIDGSIINLADYEPLQEEFLDEIVGKSLREYKKDWLRMLFADGIAIPVLLKTPEDVMVYIRTTPKSLGYLPVVPEKFESKDIKILLRF